MIDSRQLMIVLQNALGHATNIAIHNAGTEKVDVQEVVALAKLIAKEVIIVGMKKEGTK